MTTAKQYKQAAELIALGRISFCCHALQYVGGSCEEMEELFAGEPEAFLEAWMNLRGEKTEDGRERRVLALLFMAALVEEA